jgi:glycosyltransferase involved in cell wall biosynthesis
VGLATPTVPFSDYRELLRIHDQLYQRLVSQAERAFANQQDEHALQHIGAAANFAVNFHSGRFSDGTIENLALEIGRRHGSATRDLHTAAPREQTETLAERAGARRILHVLTRVYVTGGHTRMLNAWIERDSARTVHHVILTDQGDEPVPDWLVRTVHASNGKLIAQSSHTSLLERALAVGETSQRADVVVLHHHQYDVIPIVAFASDNCPPVLLLNHADHTFWLGSSVADIVVNLRSSSNQQATERRAARLNAVLPIPLTSALNESTQDCSRSERRIAAREQLGISPDARVIVSVGRIEKYLPGGPFDFLRTALKMLKADVARHMYLVGLSEEEAQDAGVLVRHDRLHYAGRVTTPVHYLDAADVYVESFPFGSNTAFLEAVLRETPVIPACAPILTQLVASNDSIDDVLSNPADENELLRRLEKVLSSPAESEQFARELRERVLEHHTGAGWLEHLDALYELAALKPHAPGAIAPSDVCESDGDLGLALRVFHGRVGAPQAIGSRTVSDERPPVKKLSAPYPHLTREIWRYGSTLAFQTGDMRAAREFALRAVKLAPLHVPSLRQLTVALLGRNAKFVASILRSVRPR